MNRSPASTCLDDLRSPITDHSRFVARADETAAPQHSFKIGTCGTIPNDCIDVTIACYAQCDSRVIRRTLWSSLGME